MYYTKEQLHKLNDNEIIEILKKEWGVENNAPIEVIGELTFLSTVNSSLYSLKNVSLIGGESIEYPLVYTRYPISNSGIFISTDNSKLEKIDVIKDVISNRETAIVTCELELSPKYERDKHDNPFELNVIIKSIKLLEKLNYKSAFFEFKNQNYIQSSILEYIKTVNNEELLNSTIDISDKIEKLEENFLLQKEDLTKQLEMDISNILTKKEELESRFLKFREEYDIKVQKKENRIKKLDNKSEILVEDIKNKEFTKESLVEKIDELRAILKDEENTMGKKLEKLRAFIKDKADNLLNLEFIDKEEYDNLLMIESHKEIDEKFIDFENDLLKNKQLAITHIQAYLFERNIIYPRYIIEDFFALVQTNDLIILAGESGSGKTNLIKSFADTIGGKSFIIPVKPNWTSAEDLLGYYNPLEKKYLSTPFLEALLEAKDNPTIPYFICLDEMNLARVEYYFADFLSLLEERGEEPEIKLYSEDESSHILSEFKNVMNTIEHVKEKYKNGNIVNFIELLKDEEINKELTQIFGFSDKDSLIKYHTDLRRMLSGILNTPSSITFPKNVRIIGAINIDETTHYLSPKILDRAHIMKFDSPLLQDWTKIANEIEDVKNKQLRIKLNIEDLGEREAYPSYDREDEFCKIITEMTKKYFSPLGVEVGLRTIRQGLNYQKIFIEQGSNKDLVLNNFFLHKILPKMTFDGNKEVNDEKKKDLLQKLTINLQEYVNQDLTKEKSINAIAELEKIIKVSESNDGIVNYWA